MSSEASQSDQSASWSELYRSGHFGQIVLLSFGVWLHAADELMISTITPAMMADIGGERFVAWLIGLYEVGSIVAGASSALLVSRFGLRPAMVMVALAYLAGCIFSGLSPSVEPMLAGRLVQGFGGGAMVAIAFIAIHRLMPGRLIARAFAVISTVWGVSAFTGPMIGAGFAEIGWWRGAFFLFAAQAAAFALLAAKGLGDSRADRAEATRPMPRAGLLLLRIGILAAGVVVIAASGIEVDRARSLPLALFGLGLLGLFFWLERQAGAGRLLPARPLDPRAPQGALFIALMMLSASTVGLMTYGPLLMARLHDADAVSIGLVLLVESIGWSLVAIALSGLPRRYETLAIGGGFTAIVIGVAGLVHFMVAGPLWAIALCAVTMGGGFGAAWTFVVRRALAIVSAEESERLASGIPTTQRLGYALGAAYVGIIANASGFADDASVAGTIHSSDWIFWLSLVPAVIGLAAGFRFLGFRERAA